MTAASELDALLRALRPPDSERRIVAIAGSVGAGKSTLARQLGAVLGEAGCATTVVSSDGFLMPNAALQARGLILRKGYPESYDVDAITRFFDEVRTGAPRVTTPRYSHAIFDIDGTEQLEVGDVLIVEGVNTLQSPIVERVDVRVYLHVEEPVVRRWFVDRMLGFINDAEHDPTSFYAQFTPLDADGRAKFAEGVWTGINLPNLTEHIEPSRANANWVITVDEHHDLLEVQELDAPRPAGGSA